MPAALNLLPLDMEARVRGAVIMEAANRLAARRGADDWHVLLLGNKGDEHLPHVALLTEQARGRVTFGGYRSDLDVLQRGCYAAVIASTGWDSFPRSGMEMQASGLPVLVSDLRGLRWNRSEHNGVHHGCSTGDAGCAGERHGRFVDEPALRDQPCGSGLAPASRPDLTVRTFSSAISPRSSDGLRSDRGRRLWHETQFEAQEALFEQLIGERRDPEADRGHDDDVHQRLSGSDYSYQAAQ